MTILFYLNFEADFDTDLLADIQQTAMSTNCHILKPKLHNLNSDNLLL